MASRTTASKAGPGQVLCTQCERTEASCECEKFCVFCQSPLDVRLCLDGIYYCEACRNACDYKTAN